MFNDRTKASQNPTLINKAFILYSQYPDSNLSFLLVLRLLVDRHGARALDRPRHPGSRWRRPLLISAPDGGARTFVPRSPLFLPRDRGNSSAMEASRRTLRPCLPPRLDPTWIHLLPATPASLAFSRVTGAPRWLPGTNVVVVVSCVEPSLTSSERQVYGVAGLCFPCSRSSVSLALTMLMHSRSLQQGPAFSRLPRSAQLQRKGRPSSAWATEAPKAWICLHRSPLHGPAASRPACVPHHRPGRGPWVSRPLSFCTIDPCAVSAHSHFFPDLRFNDFSRDCQFCRNTLALHAYNN